MGNHGGSRCRSVSAFNSLTNRLVLLNVRSHQSRIPAEFIPGEVSGQRVVHPRDRRFQGAVMRGLQDDLVEAVVGVLPAFTPPRRVLRLRSLSGGGEALIECGVKLLLSGAKSLNLIVCCLRRRKLSGKALEFRSHPIAFFNLSPRGSPDAGAAIRNHFCDPGRTQDSDRLPHRRSARSELVGNLVLPQPRAERELARGNPSTQFPCDHVGTIRCRAARCRAAECRRLCRFLARWGADRCVNSLSVGHSLDGTPRVPASQGVRVIVSGACDLGYNLRKRREGMSHA